MKRPHWLCSTAVVHHPVKVGCAGSNPVRVARLGPSRSDSPGQSEIVNRLAGKPWGRSPELRESARLVGFKWLTWLSQFFALVVQWKRHDATDVEMRVQLLPGVRDD